MNKEKDGALIRTIKGTGTFMALGIEMGASVGIPVWIGYEIDKYLETSFVILIGLFAGIGAAANALWRAVKKYRRQMEDEQQDN